jgi:hypothetical protein
MKYFFPLMMALLILAGVSLTLTPIIAEFIFPASKTTLRAADPAEAKLAMAEWLGTRPESLADVQGITQVSTQGNTSWFTFKVERAPVENFIHQHQLKQQNLTPETLQGLFMAQNPPAPWWQPAKLERQTCFIGTDEARELGLIYNADQKIGFLITRALQKTSEFK